MTAQSIFYSRFMSHLKPKTCMVRKGLKKGTGKEHVATAIGCAGSTQLPLTVNNKNTLTIFCDPSTRLTPTLGPDVCEITYMGLFGFLDYVFTSAVVGFDGRKVVVAARVSACALLRALWLREVEGQHY